MVCVKFFPRLFDCFNVFWLVKDFGLVNKVKREKIACENRIIIILKIELNFVL